MPLRLRSPGNRLIGFYSDEGEVGRCKIGESNGREKGRSKWEILGFWNYGQMGRLREWAKGWGFPLETKPTAVTWWGPTPAGGACRRGLGGISGIRMWVGLWGRGRGGSCWRKLDLPLERNKRFDFLRSEGWDFGFYAVGVGAAFISEIVKMEPIAIRPLASTLQEMSFLILLQRKANCDSNFLWDLMLWFIR